MTRRVAALILLLACSLRGQEPYGEGTVLLQGSYLGGSQHNFPAATGAAFRFRSFYPRIGLFTGSLEGYGRRVGLGAGANYLRLSGVAWGRHHWDFGGGDFSIPLAGVEYPLQNLWLPKLNVLGARVGMEGRRRRYELYGGTGTLLNGFRVPLHFQVPQQVFGAALHQQFSDRWTASVRLLQLQSTPDNLMNFERYSVPINHRFTSVRSLTAQTHYRPLDQLQLFGEVAVSATSRPAAIADVPSKPLSMTIGVDWQAKRWTANASYARQSTSYLPAMGLFLGDREGPFGAISYEILEGFSVRSSASVTRNNLERDSSNPMFLSRTGNVGASLALPAGFHLSAQMTDMYFMSETEESGRTQTDNQQLIFTAVHTLGRNRTRLSFQAFEFKQLGAHVETNRLRSWELEDNYHLGRISLGAAVRFQQSRQLHTEQSEQRDSVFFRLSGTASHGRWSALHQRGAREAI